MLCIILLALYIIFYFFKCNLLECTGRANIFIYNKIFGLLRSTFNFYWIYQFCSKSYIVFCTTIKLNLIYHALCYIWFFKTSCTQYFWYAFLRNYRCENCMVDDSLYNFTIDILFCADLAFSLTHYPNRINWFPWRIF